VTFAVLNFLYHALLMKSKTLSSFFDLKAEIAKREEGLGKSKAEVKSNVVVGINKGLKKNRNIGKHAANVDSSLPASPEPFDAARAALERKAELYDQLKSGNTAGLDDRQLETLLVSSVASISRLQVEINHT
jgi:hypothetical protein